MSEYLDVLIIGAGLSGIGAAYHLQSQCPKKSYAILEGRAAMGGTWDLFRYPGVRSDSDMHTLGYSFRPWMGDNAITDGESIRHYIEDTAAAFGIDKKIRYQHRVVAAHWSSEEARWTLTVELGAEKKRSTLSCNFIIMASGYYDYENGYTPQWQGLENYKGQIVHPQKWTDALDYTDKKVLVIGSGATAVTLVPAMSEKAAHVTMLQRSPTYVVSRPAKDKLAKFLHRILPNQMAHSLARWLSIAYQMYSYQVAKRFPNVAKRTIKNLIQEELGADFDVETHFSPPYNPWEQRLCLVPDSDLFNAMKAGKASIVTDAIKQFTENGVELVSGKALEADLIVTATGLNVKIMGGIEIWVDGQAYDFSKQLSYKGMTLSNLPNLLQAFGYTNASWTLKCELIELYACRLLNYMEEHGYDYCLPTPQEGQETQPLIDLNSGYIQRALDRLPKQGTKEPWKVYQNYILDLVTMRFGKIEDGAMQFHKKAEVRLQEKEAVL